MLDEGDLLLFSSTEPSARCLQLALSTVYQHTAVIVKLGAQEEKHVVHSNPEGVKAFPLRLILDQCHWQATQTQFGTLCIRRLLRGSGRKRVRGLSSEERLTLRRFVSSLLEKQTPFATPSSMLLSYLRFPQEEDLSRVFCSELVRPE